MNGRKVFNEINAAGFDCGLFLDEVSQHYLSDIYTTDGAVAVSGCETALITDGRYFEMAETADLSEDVKPYLFKKPLFEEVNDYLKKIGAKKVAVDPALITVKQLERLKEKCEGVEFGYLSDVCLKYRRVKTDKEIENIKNAQAITDAAFTHILGFINESRTELEVAAELEYYMRCKGASGLAFETIAVSGKKSSMPHGVPGDVRLTKDSFFTMDYGAAFNRYCSDMTRTVVLGKASDEMKRVYNTVLSAQEAGMKFIKAGVRAADADKVARDIIADAGYGEYFSHSLGHSLGLEIHERPTVSFRSDDVLVAGNIVTVEPGIYIPGKFGVRIENMVLVTETGCVNLTNSPRELIEI